MLEEDPVRSVWHLLVHLTFGEREPRVVHLGNETVSHCLQTNIVSLKSDSFTWGTNRLLCALQQLWSLGFSLFII